MKEILPILGVAGVLVSICSWGQTPRADDAEALRKLNNDFITNFLNNDTVSHNKIIHPNFLLITSSGGVMDRKAYMKDWAHGYDPQKMAEFGYDEVIVRIVGSTATVNARTKYKISKDGPWVMNNRYTDVYVKENGRWWCISAQLTPIK
ncbi:MAG: nuclear transport factor 2 family protein [Bacteroidota bacterium]